MEGILKENELTLIELKKGLICERCGFDLNKNYKYPIQREPPDIPKILSLSHLLLLEGRYYEKEKKFKEALNNYLSSLNFAQHISQDIFTTSKVGALAIEKEALDAIRDYSLKYADKDDFIKISNFQKDYLQRHFLLTDVVEIEKAAYLSSLQMLIEENIKPIKIENERIERKKEEFCNLILEEGNKLMDKYYRLLRKAAESDREEDWLFLEEELKKEKLEGLKWEILKNIIKSEPEKLDRIMANTISKTLLAISFPCSLFRRLSRKYHTIIREIEELKLEVENK